MIRKILYISIFLFLLQINGTNAGTTGSEELKDTTSRNTADECFEGFSRAMFTLNHGLDKVIFEPVPIRKGTGNMVSNLRSLLTFSNNILQGDFREAGNTAGRFAINTTVGILGIWDPAAAFGLQKTGKEDFGQTMGVWGAGSGCYFVLPILGPTTTRDAVGLIGNVFLDPVYQITHNTEISNGVVGNGNYSEHNYYFYRSTGAIDFRAKNIESFDSLERNSIDLYASIKSLYLQDRNKKIANSQSSIETQDDSDWEEIDTN